MTEPVHILNDSSPFKTSHYLALVSGIFLFLAFSGLTQTFSRLFINFHPPFSYSSLGEVYFWLGHALLLFPGACLIGYGISPWLSPYLIRAWARVEQISRKDQTIALLALLFLFFAAARLLHAVVLLDYPITDDENAALFGGQVLAMGKFRVPKPEPFAAFPQLFLIAKNGWVASKDWIGTQIGWAIAEVTGLGYLFFALAAAIPALFVALIIRKRLSSGYGFMAFFLFSFSPMALMLSMTTHAHLLSRAMLAITFFLYLLAEQQARFFLWVLMGLSAGIGFLCRPFEMAIILLPFFLSLLVRGVSRNQRNWKAIVGLFLGALGPLIVFGLHNLLLQGNVLLPAYFASNDPSLMVVSGTLWKRFGANISYNLFMLAIWFLGPLGVLLVSFGALTDRFTRLLSLSVVSILVAGLLHDNYGIHSVGPIHYSECAVPLVILAVYGLANIRERLRRCGISFLIPANILACVLVLGLGTFNFWHSRALNNQAVIQNYIYRFIDGSIHEKRVNKAIVLAPQFGSLWIRNDYFRNIGSWVFEWRRVKPDLSDEIMILHDIPEVEELLRKKFPDRVFFRIRNSLKPPFFELVPALPPTPSQDEFNQP